MNEVDWRLVDFYLSPAVERLKSEGLSKKQIAKALREKASEVCPRRRTVYCLPDGTEISRKEYLALQEIFGKKRVKLAVEK